MCFTTLTQFSTYISPCKHQLYPQAAKCCKKVLACLPIYKTKKTVIAHHGNKLVPDVTSFKPPPKKDTLFHLIQI